MEIEDSDSVKASSKKPNIDLEYFFEPPTALSENDKSSRRICKLCKSITKQENTLVNQHTTLRRHLASKHKGAYYKWCKTTGFISMLPQDTKARCQEASNARSMEQTTVDSHFQKLEAGGQKILYSNEFFREAAIQWLVETDQPLQAFEHPSFVNMINIASKATRDISLPNRKQTRESIM
ncbi:hypothetical protein C0992_010055, partial [Termitomyces sp. T32_za158]